MNSVICNVLSHLKTGHLTFFAFLKYSVVNRMTKASIAQSARLESEENNLEWLPI